MHASNRDTLNDWENLVRDRVRNLRFGTVLVTVHQGRVTQIEATEKIRLEDSAVAPRRPFYVAPKETDVSTV